MDRDAVLQELHAHWLELQRRGVKSLTLFGPLARKELKPNGEINFILELAPPHSLDHFLEVKGYLIGLLNYAQIELVMVNAHHPDIWPLIGPDAIEIL